MGIRRKGVACLFLALVGSGAAVFAGDKVPDTEFKPIHWDEETKWRHYPEYVRHIRENMASPECARDKSLRDPDQPARAWRLLPRGLASIVDVVFHGTTGSDFMENSGIRKYMGESLATEDAFLDAATGFYSELYKVELYHPPKTNDPLHWRIWEPDQKDMRDLYPIALKAARGNPYLALKAMAYYGHDDDQDGRGATYEGSSCRASELSSFRPVTTSYLYAPGALHGLKYTSAQVSQAKEYRKKCAELLSIFGCDPGQEDLADYYHIIVGAFLGCRATIEMNAKKGWLSPQEIQNRYLLGVRDYKLDRVVDHLNDMARHEFSDQAIPWFNDRTALIYELSVVAVKRLRTFSNPLLDDYRHFKSRLSPEDYAKLKDFVSYWDFVSDLRMSQHKMGWDFGAQACGKMKSYDEIPFPEGADSSASLQLERKSNSGNDSDVGKPGLPSEIAR